MSQQEFELYDRTEETHWWFKGRRSILRTVLNIIPSVSEKHLLEVGCGSGGNLKFLFTNFKSTSGLEIDQNALRIAKKKLPTTQVIAGDANTLNAVGRKFDCIAFCDILYHEKILSVESVLNQANQILEEDGYLLITDGAFNFLEGAHTKNVGSARRFTKTQMIKLVSDAGFEVKKCSYWGVAIFFILFLKRRVLEKFSNPEANADSHDVVSIPLFDQFMYFILKIESVFISFVNLPIGASIVVLAKKQRAGK